MLPASTTPTSEGEKIEKKPKKEGPSGSASDSSSELHARETFENAVQYLPSMRGTEFSQSLGPIEDALVS